jgi:hypothetical protein
MDGGTDTTRTILLPQLSAELKMHYLFIFFPNHASYDRLPELGNRNAQFDVFHRLSRAISTSLTLVGD